MITWPKLSLIKLAACIFILVCIVALVIILSGTPPPQPKLICSTFNPKTGRIAVVLTNATTAIWSCGMHLVRGSPTLGYYINYPIPKKKILSGWGSEFEEGIYCSSLLYRYDASGKYLPPEQVKSPFPVTVGYSNVVLRPQQSLTFYVPVGHIRGLSKVGVGCRRLPSSGIERMHANVNLIVRRMFHLPPPEAYESWIVMALPGEPSLPEVEVK